MYTNAQIRFLRARAHHLKPLVHVGQRGVTPALLQELELALTAHELLKVKVAAGDRALRAAAIARLCDTNGAFLVQRIGNTAVLYRPHPEKPRLEVPPGGKP